jgi:predicted sulfurtransferase
MSALSESINEIKTHILVAESELNDLIAGKKASAGRVRKSLQQIKKLSHLLRKAIVEFTKTLPVKKRAKTVESVVEPVVESKPIVVKRKRTPKRDPSL